MMSESWWTPQTWMCVALMGIGFMIQVALYRRLPPVLASHFAPDGRPNDAAGKLPFLLLILAVQLFLIAVMSWERVREATMTGNARLGFHLENYKVVLVGFFTFLQVFVVLVNARLIRFSLWVVNIPIAVVVIYGLYLGYLRYDAWSGRY